MRPSSRGIRLAAALGAALLFATTLTSAPTVAQTASPTIEVHESGYGWFSMMGNDWTNSPVQVTVHDDTGAEASSFEAQIGSNGGFSAHLDVEGFGLGWSVTADDNVGAPKSIEVPSLAVDRVDTSTREVSGTSEDGLAFSVEACQGSPNGPTCESVTVVNDDGTPEWTSPALATVQDHYLGARWIDGDGDAFVAGYPWPGVSYRRTVTPLVQSHDLNLSLFPPDSDVAVAIVDPGGSFGQEFDVRTNETASQSIPNSATLRMSASSLTVSAGADNPPPLRLMPFLFASRPPTVTVHSTRVPTTCPTLSMMFPSSSNRTSPGATSSAS